jgi:hypothetical protein
MPIYWIYGFHALFYATFLPRALARRARPAPPTAGASAPAATARFSRGLLAAGSFLWIPNALVLAGMLLVFLAGDLRARAEEKVLAAAFGDRYRDYAARVKRFVPGVY